MKFVSFLIFACIFDGIKADTPANCTFDDIKGKWTFYEGSRGHSSDISCNGTGVNPTHQLHLELVFPNIAIDHFGNKGTWTLIYNQGFEVHINSRRYFAFSNWTNIYHHKVISKCHETKGGWSHDVYVRDWSCFVGRRRKPATKIHHRPINDDQATILRLKSRHFRINNRMISKINQKQKSWKAGAYPEWQQYTHFDVLQRFGGLKSRVHHRPVKAQQEFNVADYQFQLDSLPESFDWRNVRGQNFVSAVRNQGNCGSCYAFASAAMLEARYRILTNNTIKPIFSPQDVVECSEYSQGCAGGFAYLIAGKYAEDFGMVPESCNPYHSPTSAEATCQTQKDCRRFYATNYRYIGGYFGACNEPLMRLSLVRNGPIAVGFEVYADFQGYKGGIYHHTGIKDDLNRIDQTIGIRQEENKRMKRGHNWELGEKKHRNDALKWNPLQLTNHAVLVVGYGSDPKTNEDYWIVKNSWGPGWGEQGFFRIRRGVDECGIESMATEATPIPTY